MPKSLSPRTYVKRGMAERRAKALSAQLAFELSQPEALRTKTAKLVESYSVGSAAGISARFAFGWAVFAKLNDGRVIVCA